MGDRYSVCDPYALVFYGWGKRIDLPVETLKNYTAWKNRMLARKAVRTVLEREKASSCPRPRRPKGEAAVSAAAMDTSAPALHDLPGGRLGASVNPLVADTGTPPIPEAQAGSPVMTAPTGRSSTCPRRSGLPAASGLRRAADRGRNAVETSNTGSSPATPSCAAPMRRISPACTAP
jgi:hypothetical protein